MQIRTCTKAERLGYKIFVWIPYFKLRNSKAGHSDVNCSFSIWDLFIGYLAFSLNSASQLYLHLPLGFPPAKSPLHPSDPSEALWTSQYSQVFLLGNSWVFILSPYSYRSCCPVSSPSKLLLGRVIRKCVSYKSETFMSSNARPK